MKKTLKIGLIVLILLFGISKFLEWILESRFENLINAEPDRSYNITYEDFNLNTFFNGITLDKVNITPLNKTKGTIINGTVDYAELTGFEWTKYLFDKSLKIDGLSFISPEFYINIVEDTLSKKKKKNGSSFQNLFNDILSRADLNQFEINDGAIVIKEEDSIIIGRVHRINILATDIETNSKQNTHIIPFKLGNVEVDIDSMFYQINPYTTAKLGTLKYSIANERIDLKNLSLQYDKDWIAISKQRGIQDDVMEFSLKSISITDINFNSNFWSDLDIEAHKMEIDSLTLSMKRNKNLKRPKDVEKQLFSGLINKIPNRIDLDSINIVNSTIIYGELSVNKEHTGVIEINDINGSITNLTTFAERKKEFGEFNASFTARLNDAANMTIDFQIPYDEDTFQLHTTLVDLDMKALSPSLKPLLGVEITDGNLRRLDYRMNASHYQSNNTLIMDYDNLQLLVYEEYDDGTLHKKGFMSSIANAAIRQQNLPEDKKYFTASYTTKRNIYRSPFQHIVAGALDGVQYIVPTRGVQSLFHKKGRIRKKRNKN